MSDSDFSGRLPGPVTGRPRRPLSKRLSTASWSIRFSLFTMISGAPRSRSLLRRLFRLMTRRYRSFGPEDLAQVVRLGVEVEGRQPVLDGLGAHAAAEVPAEPVPHLAVQELVALQVLNLQALEPGPDLVQPVDLLAGPVADLLALTVAALAKLALLVGLGARGLELGEVCLQLGLAGLDVVVPALLELVPLDRDLRLQGRQVALATLVVHEGDHVGGEVNDLFQVLRRQVEQVAEPRRHTLEVPDVRDRGGQLDVAHPLPAHLGASDLDAAALTDDALEPDALVLAAVALPVPGRTEDLLAEEPVLFRLERAVVDGLRLLHLTVRPLPDVLGRGQPDAKVVEEVDV